MTNLSPPTLPATTSKKVVNSDTDRSIVQELKDLGNEGVTSSFSVIPGAKLRCEACNELHPAAMMTLLEVRRLEGKSDPSEMAAVLTLRCGHCQAEGACVLSFGPMASAEDQDVMLALGADERVTDGEATGKH